MTWTKFSERLPEESQEQVYMAPPNGKVSTTRRNPGNPWADYYGRDLQPAAMWHPITYPEVPKEETQKEKDRAAYESCISTGTFSYNVVWDAALRYERAEVAKELNTGAGNIAVRSKIPSMEAINRLRRRVGLDK